MTTKYNYHDAMDEMVRKQAATLFPTSAQLEAAVGNGLAERINESLESVLCGNGGKYLDEVTAAGCIVGNEDLLLNAIYDELEDGRVGYDEAIANIVMMTPSQKDSTIRYYLLWDAAERYEDELRRDIASRLPRNEMYDNLTALQDVIYPPESDDEAEWDAFDRGHIVISYVDGNGVTRASASLWTHCQYIETIDEAIKEIKRIAREDGVEDDFDFS